ncbi:MAG: hypothetical protein OXC82_07710 [Rhodobacteraceae bacterium]|nr:hypothetical protein [Paracoccaceae bacterium]MCY4250301.1 hypothetical protein [Paracoccaceae bacterium]
MRRQLAPLLHQDDDPKGAEKRRSSPMAKSVVSKRGEMKFRTHRTEEGLPVHGFRTLLADLGTMALNLVRPPGTTETVPIVALPTVIQKRALELLGVGMDWAVPIIGAGWKRPASALKPQGKGIDDGSVTKLFGKIQINR